MQSINFKTMQETIIQIAPAVFFIALFVLSLAITDTIIEYKEYNELRKREQFKSRLRKL